VTNQPFFCRHFSYDNDKYLLDNMNNKAGVDIDANGKWVNGERGQESRERERNIDRGRQE